MTKKINIEELKARISYEELYDLYITQNKSAKTIRNIYNISINAFLLLIKEYNIVKKFTSKEIDNILTKEILEKEYLENKLSAKVIGKKYRVHEETVLNRLSKYNIEKLNIARKNKYKKIKENLYDQYIIQNKSITQIAKENKMDKRTVSKFIKELNLTKSEEQLKQSSKITLRENHSIQELKILYKKRAEHQTLDLERRFKEALTNITYEDFYNYYVIENHNRKEILEHYKISNKLFMKLRKYFCINKYEYLKTKAPSREKLYQLYVVEGKTICAIAKELKCSHTIIGRLVVKYDLSVNDKERYNRIWQTRKARGTTNTSKPEDNAYAMLRAKFPQTLRNHATSQYPFHCDFYIPELDLYIEYQGDPSHGKEPYDASNPKHQKILKTWQQKAQKIEEETGKQSRYLSFIKVWTNSDPLKRQTAAANHLNWLEFFTFGAFLDWFNALP